MHLDQWTIEGEMTISWTITKFGRSAHRVIWDWQQLVCPRSPLLLNGFQSSLISLESYFQGESNAVCYEERGLLVMENVGNYRNRATWIMLKILLYIQSGLILFWTSPFTLRTFFSHSSSLEVAFGVDFRETWVSLVVLQGFKVLG